MDIEIPQFQYEKYISGTNCPDLYGTSGEEHYRLLAYLSTLFNGSEIFDFRTGNGYQAYALAYNDKNKVLTFDVTNNVTKQSIKNRSNISFNQCDLMDPIEFQPWLNRVLASPLIFLDRDPHEGHKEYQFYCFLKDHDYQGMLICDDIWHFKELRDHFWSKIPIQFKFDLTAYGHWSGTGLVVFTNKYDHLLPRRSSNQDWTLVTAYINLMGTPDMNQFVRTKDYYLAHSQATMSVPYNLVVYCDQESLEDLKRLRPTHLANQTKYIVVDFEQLKFTGHDMEMETFSQYRHKIALNRQKKPYKFDPRNNPSYYLFCLARYLLLKRTIVENPFSSSHFAWINICIERMGFKNLIHLDEALSVHRDKFSTCYIDYQPKTLINDLNEYFREGRCGMCSGFFTGHRKYMYQICHAIETEFLFCLNHGYGHADEQLYSIVYFKQPELFEHYYGDYAQMITNYCYIYENPQTTLNRFIKNSFNAEAYQTCLKGIDFVWTSFTLHKCHLNLEETKQLSFYKKLCDYEIKNRMPPLPLPLLTQQQIRAGEGQILFPSQQLMTPVPVPPTSTNSVSPVEAPVTTVVPTITYQTTIITLLYDVGNPAHVSNMLNHAHHWLPIKSPVVIWTDDSCYSTLQVLFSNKKNVIINKRNINEFETYQYVDQIRGLQDKYEIKNRSLTKDTLQYHMLMYARPYMWAETIKSNPFNTDTFICMDFGLYRFTKDLTVVDRWNINDKLKMLLIQQYFPSDPQPKDYFHWTRHNIAGGIVTGSGKNILNYVELFESELKDMIANEWYQLDEALTAIIVRKHPDLCDFYYGDYSGIIDNYEITRNMMNVPETIQRYLNKQMFTEAQKIIDTIDYNYSSKCLYYFVEYSVLTNYYTMEGSLNPVVKRVLNDPVNIGLRKNIEENHTRNLPFYKNYDSTASEIVKLNGKITDLENGLNVILCHAAKTGQSELCELARKIGANDFNSMFTHAVLSGHNNICELARRWGAST